MIIEPISGGEIQVTTTGTVYHPKFIFYLRELDGQVYITPLDGKRGMEINGDGIRQKVISTPIRLRTPES